MSQLTSKQVIGIIEKLERFLNDSEYVAATSFYGSKVLLALLSKALTVGRAVCALVDADFPAEAYGLSRTLIEIFLTVRYVSNRDVEARATEYVEYIGKTQEHLRKVAAKHLPNTTIPPLDETFTEMAKKYQSPFFWLQSNTGQGRALATEPDAYEQDASGNPLTASLDYDHEYHQTSFHVHATIQALLGHSASNREIFRVRANISQQRNLSGKALFNVLTSISKAFICAFRGLRDDQPEEILQELNGLITAYVKEEPQNR